MTWPTVLRVEINRAFGGVSKKQKAGDIKNVTDRTRIRWSRNNSKPSGHYMYRQFKHSTILRSAHTVDVCGLCGSQNKLRLFPYTALTDYFDNRDLTLYSPVVTICTTSLTFNNSMFCPHTVFMWFVWISDKQRLFPNAALNDWFL